MKDYWTHLEALRKPAAESALISALAIDPQKRELFAKHAAHISAWAAEVEHAMAANKVEPPFRQSGCRWTRHAAKPARSSTSLRRSASRPSLRTGGNSPTVRLNLR
jgi:hypothetical protein